MSRNKSHFLSDANRSDAAPPSLASACRDLHEQEGGMVMIISVVAFLFFLLLANLVWNIGWSSTTKMNVQNASDATSYSSALWMARGHNAITATNHMMGEMMSFVVIRSAMGEKNDKRKQHGANGFPVSTFPKALGDAPDQENRFSTAGPQLKTVHDTVANSPARPQLPIIAFPRMEDSPEVKGNNIEMGSTISDGRYYLIKILTAVYIIRGVGGALEKIPFPPITAIGYALDGIGLGVEAVVLVEWYCLKGMEKVYTATEVIHDAIWKAGMPFASKFQKDFIVNAVPPIAVIAGKKIAADNGAKGMIYPYLPGELKFFVEDDPGGKKGESDSENEAMRNSQIVRATYPFVKFHRRPILDILNFMKLSNSAYNYVFWTNDYTLLKCREIYKDQGCYMLVLEGSEPHTKREGTWQPPDAATLERRHAIVGFAHRKTPRYSAPRLLGTPLQKGIATYSMALVYNANKVDQAADAAFQPNRGWDTLNWELPTSDSFAFELPEEPDPTRNGHSESMFRYNRPKIKLNWQAKLVPASNSYLNEAIAATPGPHRDLMLRLLVVPPGLRREFLTH